VLVSNNPPLLLSIIDEGRNPVKLFRSIHDDALLMRGMIQTMTTVRNIPTPAEAAAVPVSTVWQLPPAPVAFTGRENELRDLEAALTSGNWQGAVISGVNEDSGGIGKTGLAVVLAHRLKDRHPEAQLFLNLRGVDADGRPPLTPAEAMQRVIHVFHPKSKLPEDAAALAPVYQAVLAKAGRVLLLLDNAADADQVNALLPKAKCLVLVTSRARIEVPGLAPCAIDSLPPDKARELLLSLAPRIENRAGEAAELCGHLPLALVLFAGAVNSSTLPFVPEMIAALRDDRESLGPAEAAFRCAYGAADENVRPYYCLLAAIPAPFDLHAAGAIFQADAAYARGILQPLVNANLVEWNPALNRFHLHDLLRQFCEDSLEEYERRATRHRHASHYLNAGAAAQKLYEKGDDDIQRALEMFDRDREHIEAAFDWLDGRTDSESAAVLIELVNAVNKIGLNVRFSRQERIQWLESQRNAARRIKDQSAEGRALRNLGQAYAAIGDAATAIAFHQESLAIERETGNRLEEAESFGHLGSAYATLGETRKAVELYQQYLLMARQLGDRKDEADALSNLGAAHTSLGDPRAAIRFLDQALEIAVDIADRHVESKALGHLGLAYAALGETEKACDLYEQALLLARQIGDQRAEGATALNSAIALADSGDKALAIARAQAALRIFESFDDPNATRAQALLRKFRAS
jgi:tetratricopeptide (TPR) repeat protein